MERSLLGMDTEIEEVPRFCKTHVMIGGCVSGGTSAAVVVSKSLVPPL